MTYTALYRRYRPQRFGELIGQEHISRVLAAAVRRDEPVHAYLFCGPRGTGKTSAARILARAINCQTPLENGDPCGQCPACQRDLAGESMDVIEIDGASNRGIDEIRDLRERVKYAPAQEKHKIYIIDEVHMLTDQAFNALLKTLEEPPAHVVFIFATTDPHKVPLTVISRCQRFDFRRISHQAIADHLLDIAARESIPLTPEAAALIARKADGGMRDAVSLLDQCAGVYAGSGPESQITPEAVSALLGVVDHSFVLELLRLLLAQDLTGVLDRVDQMVRAGKDLRQALSDLQEAIRDTLLQVMAKDPALPEWAAAASPGRYLALLQALSDTDSRMRFALSPRIALELALMRACGLAEEAAPPLPTAQAASSPKPAAPGKKPAPTEAPPAPTEAPAPIEARTGDESTPSKASSGPKETVAPQPVPPTAPPPPSFPLETVAAAWPDILAKLGAKKPGLSALLEGTFPARIEGRVLFVDFPPEMELFLSSFAQDGQYKTLVENAVNSACRSALRIQPFTGAPRPEPAAKPDPADASEDVPPPEEAPPEDESSLF